jgi:hypothetical protein
MQSSKQEIPADRVLTPRPYLSWSQMQLFERDPAAYIARYIYGEDERTSAAATFGKRIAAGLEAAATEDAEIEQLRRCLPAFPEKEYEITAEFSGVPMLAKPDLFNPQEVQIGELKTGAYPWTQERVNNHGQLKFYALAAWLKYQRFPQIELYWAPTVWRGNKLCLTGEINTFKAEITLEAVLAFGARLPVVWEGIQKVTREYGQKFDETN